MILSDELDRHGIGLVTHTTYAMVPIARLPVVVCDAFAADRVEAVLHYSRRSARLLSPPPAPTASKSPPSHCRNAAYPIRLQPRCVTRAPRKVMVARSPDETAMLETVLRVLRTSRG